jgi:hypothetical protein
MAYEKELNELDHNLAVENDIVFASIAQHAAHDIDELEDYIGVVARAADAGVEEFDHYLAVLHVYGSD